MGPSDVIGLACVAAVVAPCLAGVEIPGWRRCRPGPIARGLAAAVLAWLAVALSGLVVLAIVGAIDAAHR